MPHKLIEELLAFADKHDMLPRGVTVVAAVSGGADSTALLTALCELAPPRALNILAAHFDHRLRGEESDRDREFVRSLCESLGVPCHIGAGDARERARTRGRGIEDAARELRYDFFAGLTASLPPSARVAVAHTADDNAETMLFNLARGSGSRGLAGIPPARGNIIRPMLSVTRADVNAFLAERGVSHVEDSTNGDEVYSRNAIRRRAIPVLREINPRFALHALRAAERLREDDAYLTSLARDFIAARRENGAVPVGELLALPPPVFARAVTALAGGRLSSERIAAISSLCGNISGTARVSIPGGVVTREYGRLIFTAHKAASAAVSAFYPVSPEPRSHAVIPELALRVSLRDAVCPRDIKSFYKETEKIHKRFTVFLFKKSAVCGRIVVRPREAGDTLAILGGNGVKSLKKLFIEKKIPASRRGLVPVIADALGPLAVFGVAAGARAAPEVGDAAAEISFERLYDGVAYGRSFV